MKLPQIWFDQTHKNYIKKKKVKNNIKEDMDQLLLPVDFVAGIYFNMFPENLL